MCINPRVTNEQFGELVDYYQVCLKYTSSSTYIDLVMNPKSWWWICVDIYKFNVAISIILYIATYSSSYTFSFISKGLDRNLHHHLSPLSFFYIFSHVALPAYYQSSSPSFLLHLCQLSTLYFFSPPPPPPLRKSRMMILPCSTADTRRPLVCSRRPCKYSLTVDQMKVVVDIDVLILALVTLVSLFL